MRPRAELAEVRERGWSVDREEFREGVAWVAAPALVGDALIAAYTVAWPAERYKALADELRVAVQCAAAAAADHPDAMEAP